MSIKSYFLNGKKYYEVYVNGFDRSGNRIHTRRKGIESLRKADEAEFELKRELAKLKEQGVAPRWSEWLEECQRIMKVQYRPSTLYNYNKTLQKWIHRQAARVIKAFVSPLGSPTLSSMT